MKEAQYYWTNTEGNREFKTIPEILRRTESHTVTVSARPVQNVSRRAGNSGAHYATLWNTYLSRMYMT